MKPSTKRFILGFWMDVKKLKSTISSSTASSSQITHPKHSIPLDKQLTAYIAALWLPSHSALCLHLIGDMVHDFAASTGAIPNGIHELIQRIERNAFNTESSSESSSESGSNTDQNGNNLHHFL